MIRLKNALQAWGTPDFDAALKIELEAINPEALPLQQGLSMSSYVADQKFRVTVLNIFEHEQIIRIKAGIFYSGILAGCSCADDPTPSNENPEYCVVQIDVNKRTAEATVALLPE